MPNLNSLGWNAQDSVEANAKLLLPKLAREYFIAGRRIAIAQPGPLELHQFRLATKRFRYTLEMFREVYGETLHARLESLKPIQKALGELNDCISTKEQFENNECFCNFLDARAHCMQLAFYRAWKTSFDMPGEQDRWIRYLSRVPKRVTPDSTRHRQPLFVR